MASSAVHRPYFGKRSGARIGLLGGSFNPAHGGHRYISQEALRRLGLDQVWWLVAPQNPLKAASSMAPYSERLASARKQADSPRLIVSDLEARLGTRYTADTLARLTRRAPGVRFVWLMGADSFAELHRWKRWPRIFQCAVIAVFARAPYDSKALASKAAHRFRHARLKPGQARGVAGHGTSAWVYLPLRRHPASASAIRAAASRAGGAR